MKYTSCAMLVQELLVAKRDLRLSKEIKKLARFDGLIIDDMGYVQQNREEMEVLFTLLAERYERSSVLLSSNLPFSTWEGIFKDPMTTAAAIVRLVHHCVILELNILSYRMEEAKKNRDAGLESGGANWRSIFSRLRKRKTRPPLSCGKSRSVESEENQQPVSLSSHLPWKSRTTRGISPFPTAPTAAGICQKR